MNAFDSLVFLVFFAPLAIMVALNLVLYRAERYTIQPPMPREAPTPAPSKVEMLQPELRKAA